MENYALLRRLWREDVVTWEGKFRTPLQSFTSTPRPLDGVPPFVWHGSIRSPEIAEQPRTTVTGSSTTTSSGRPTTPSGWSSSTGSGTRTTGTARPSRRSSVSAGLLIRKNSQDAVREFRPYFDNAPVYGHGPSLEEFTNQTPLTVGSPQEVVEKTLAFREYAGDYQRQLFLVDHAGLPLKTVLEQLDLLGEEVVPVLARSSPRGARRMCRTRRPTSPCSRPRK